MVFLCETRQKNEKIRKFQTRLGLKGFVGKDSDGLSGGLALYWNENLEVNVNDVTDRYIDAFVRISPDDPLWHLTCVYGEPRTENCHCMWSHIMDLNSRYDLPWCMLGDFNEALWAFEHFSFTPRPEQQMLAFCDTLELCELVDLGFSGIPFTYDNRRRGRSNVKVRLDRVVVTNDWRDIFGDASVVHLVSPC
jgi:hypothetical protein